MYNVGALCYTISLKKTQFFFIHLLLQIGRIHLIKWDLTLPKMEQS